MSYLTGDCRTRLLRAAVESARDWAPESGVTPKDAKNEKSHILCKRLKQEEEVS